MASIEVDLTVEKAIDLIVECFFADDIWEMQIVIDFQDGIYPFKDVLCIFLEKRDGIGMIMIYAPDGELESDLDVVGISKLHDKFLSLGWAVNSKTSKAMTFSFSSKKIFKFEVSMEFALSTEVPARDLYSCLRLAAQVCSFPENLGCSLTVESGHKNQSDLEQRLFKAKFEGGEMSGRQKIKFGKSSAFGSASYNSNAPVRESLPSRSSVEAVPSNRSGANLSVQDKIEALEKLAKLKEIGALTAEEFGREKSKLLGA